MKARKNIAMRKNIALLVSSWNHDSQEKITAGIWRRAKQQGYNVAVFTCHGGKNNNRRYDIGEYNIFELVNLELFDGIILAGQTIMAQTVKDRLAERIRESGIPAVSLEERIKGFRFVGIDNYHAMKNMLEHLGQKHSYGHISYVTGPDDNYESIQRLRAYLDCKEQYGWEGCVWNGDYTFESGRYVIKEMFRNGGPLPRAIACANDFMALGVCHELKQHEVKIPQEVAVMGFDNNYDASNYWPGISSVARPKEELGYTACEVLLNIIEGSEQGDKVMDTHLVVRNSCGCEEIDMLDYGKFRENAFWTKQQSSKYHVLFREMKDDMLECDDFRELFLCIHKNLKKFAPEEVTICLNETVMRCLTTDVGKSVDKKSIVYGYEDEIYIPHYQEKKNEIGYTSYPLPIMFPALLYENRENDIYIFSPLHFRDKCFGFIVMNGGLQSLSIPFYFTWVQNISNAFEEMQNIALLSRAVEELNEFSIKDSLTGLYNRSAILRFLPAMMQKARDWEQNLLYCFVDMDGLKMINDKYGHSVGDRAIVTVAEVLKEIFCEDEMLIRYGGDEFLLIARGGTEHWIVEMEAKVSDTLRSLSWQKGLPFTLSISMGWHMEKCNMENSAEHCIRLADDRMYLVKNEKRRKEADNESN